MIASGTVYSDVLGVSTSVGSTREGLSGGTGRGSRTEQERGQVADVPVVHLSVSVHVRHRERDGRGTRGAISLLERYQIGEKIPTNKGSGERISPPPNEPDPPKIPIQSSPFLWCCRWGDGLEVTIAISNINGHFQGCQVAISQAEYRGYSGYSHYLSRIHRETPDQADVETPWGIGSGRDRDPEMNRRDFRDPSMIAGHPTRFCPEIRGSVRISSP
jgi:hypothetical protein